MIVKRVRNIRNKRKYGHYKNMDSRTFVILDDCMAYDKKWKNDPAVKCIFMNGRYLKMTFVLSSQNALGLPPDLRNNVDFVFLCRENRTEVREKLYKSWGSIFPDKNVFYKALTECTSDYKCLVIDNVEKKDVLTDRVFWYKSKIHSNFKCCEKRYWKNNKAYMDDSSSDDYSYNNHNYKHCFEKNESKKVSIRHKII